MTATSPIAEPDFAPAPTCQGCGAPVCRTLVDLGMQPLANSYIAPGRQDEAEPLFPLHARICDECLLVQVDTVTAPENIFNQGYAYFSSFSESWLTHCKAYADAMTSRFGLGRNSQVVEIASNDGYMLQYFVEKGIPVLGVEPAGNVAQKARTRGIPTEIAFFGVETAERLAASGIAADLLAAKNVMAHVPHINDFVAGIPRMLKPEGVFTVEFPHLLNLLRETQFDTIYHEHFTYLSLLAVDTIFRRHGLKIFDVEKQTTHGGSLRVFAARLNSSHEVSRNVDAVLAEERGAGLDRPGGYEGFEDRVRAVRSGLLDFLAEARKAEALVVAYGAAAKGNTLLNYCGVTTREIAFVVDRNPAKQSTLLPGSRIPVRDPSALNDVDPAYVLILPWNLRDEIVAQNGELANRGARFVTAIPSLRIV